MNSGIVLWVQDEDLAQAQRILDNIDTDTTAETLLDNMSDADLGINTADTQINRGTQDS